MFSQRLFLVWMLWLSTLSCRAASLSGVPHFTAAYAGRTVELRQSAYFGPLYDDTDRLLLSPHTPASTSHLVNLRGEPLHPPKARGILPSGSQFVVRRVSLPSRLSLLTRMLKSPRFHPWVELRLLPQPAAPLAGSQPPTERPFVWVLPLTARDAKEIATAMAEAFSSPPQTAQFLAARRPTVAVAIAQKSLLLDMTTAEMVAAMGPPQRAFVEQRQAQRLQVAWYADTEAWLQDGRIVALRPPRPLLPAPPAADKS